MTLYDVPEDLEGVHRLLQRLWSKAKGARHYNKAEWMALQQAVFLMAGLTPPPQREIEEPSPWESGEDELLAP